MGDKKRRVVVVGGGLTGLSAAFYIRKHYREAGVEPVITCDYLGREKLVHGRHD